MFGVFVFIQKSDRPKMFVNNRFFYIEIDYELNRLNLLVLNLFKLIKIQKSAALSSGKKEISTLNVHIQINSKLS